MPRIFIDVREPDECCVSKVTNAINIPLGDISNIASYFDKLDKNTELVVYCRTGNRSNIAKIKLEKMGYKNVINGINKAHCEETYGLRAI